MINNSSFNMRQYDEHLQEQRRSYGDAQYDMQILSNLTRQLWASVILPFSWMASRAAQPQPATYQEQSEFADALHAGLSRGVGRC